MIIFEINAKPFGKERPRFGRGTVYTPPKTAALEIMIGNLAKQAMRGKKIIKGSVIAHITVREKIPDSWPEWKKTAAICGRIRHTKKPDLDNIAKLILDSINNIVYKDDSQVTYLRINKQYSNANTTLVNIEETGDAPCNVKTLKEYRALVDKLI